MNRHVPEPKELVFSVLLLAVSAIFWFLLTASIDASRGLSEHWEGIVGLGIATVLVFGLWLGGLFLGGLLLPTTAFLVVAVLIGGLGGLSSSSQAVIGFGCLLVIAGLASFYFRLRRLADNELRLNLSSLLRRSIGSVLTAILLLTALMVYSDFSQTQRTPSNTITNLSVGVGNLANQLLPAVIPNYEPELTLDEFLVKTMLESISKSGPSKENLPPELRRQLEAGDVDVDQLIEQIPASERDRLRSEFLQPFGLAGLEGDAPMTVVVQRIVDSKAQVWLKPVEPFIPPFVAVGLFLLLNVFRWLFLLLAQAWALLLFRFFLATGLAAVRIEDRKKEVVEWGGT